MANYAKFLLLLLLQITMNHSQAASQVPLVFIHGIKGGVLANTSGDRVWLTGLQAIGVSAPLLSLPLSWTGQEQDRDTLGAVGILEKVRIIPGLFEEPVYGPFLEAARKLGRPFREFAYDWRRDNLETLDRFEKFLVETQAQNSGARVQVVSHSMGGLITFALLKRRPELFSSVVFVGVPFSGGIGFLEDLHAGLATGLNKRILSPAVLFSFPSVYALFPATGEGLADNTGRPLPFNFFEAHGWRSQGLSRFAEPDAPAEVLEGFLSKALARAKAFRDLLAPGGGPFPPIWVVAADNRPTLAQVRRGGPKSIRGWDFETAPKESGDGRVRFAHALPPEGVPHLLIRSSLEHSQVINDPQVISLCKP